MELEGVVRRTKKNTENDAKYKVTQSPELKSLKFSSNRAKAISIIVHLANPLWVLKIDTKNPKICKLQSFLDAILQHFSAIGVKKTQSERKKGKTHKEALDIYNEIKIITS